MGRIRLLHDSASLPGYVAVSWVPWRLLYPLTPVLSSMEQALPEVERIPGPTTTAMARFPASVLSPCLIASEGAAYSGLLLHRERLEMVISSSPCRW